MAWPSDTLRTTIEGEEVPISHRAFQFAINHAKETGKPEVAESLRQKYAAAVASANSPSPETTES
jgi:hypothetical protein